MSPLRIVVAGAAGRMGQALIRAIDASDDLLLFGALEAEGGKYLGQDAATFAGVKAADVLFTSDAQPLLAGADAVIDFSAPKVSVELAVLCAQAQIVHIIGTTGFSPQEEEMIGVAAAHTAIVKSGNMSPGVTVLAALIKQAAKALPDFDIEIVEIHHRMKVDAPSGTALLLGNAAADGRGISLPGNAVMSHQGHTGARKSGSIGFASLRGGTVVGEHDVVLAGSGERLVLRHIAEDRAIFAKGALAAARWGQGKKPGLYSMTDVLGLS